MEDQDGSRLDTHKCVEALKGEPNMPTSMSQKEMTSMINKAKCSTILCLGDKALREVAKEKIIASMWMKL